MGKIVEQEVQASSYLFVDLDGTLVKSDLFFEGLVALAKLSPWLLLQVVWVLISKGKAAAKARLAPLINPDFQLTPLTTHFFDYLLNEKKAGRKVVLATASNQLWAEQVCRHFNVFDGFIASDEKFNCRGANKLAKIKEYSAGAPFEYCGNDHCDLPIWIEAQEITLVNASPSVIQQACKIKQPKYLFNEHYQDIWKSFLRILRPHQWAKNILVFLPLCLAHKLLDFISLLHAFQGFMVFCVTASAVYILNDLSDLEADRLHSTKQKRPLAAGDFPVKYALMFLPLLIISGIALAITLPPTFFAIVLIYLLTTTAYSLYLKQIVVLDIIILALLYTIRILAGGVAANVTVSFWLMAFSLFFFFSLAALKRYIELVRSTALSKNIARRGYSAVDLNIVAVAGIAGGIISVLVMALYINNIEITRLYTEVEYLWFVCPALLYWITRIWILANRGEVHDDPVIFAAKDQVTYLVGFLTVILLYLAK